MTPVCVKSDVSTSAAVIALAEVPGAEAGVEVAASTSRARAGAARVRGGEEGEGVVERGHGAFVVGRPGL